MQKAIKTYSTDMVGESQRVDYWNDLLCGTFTALEATPTTRDHFQGQLQKARLGDLGIAEVLSVPTTVSHTRAMVSNETRGFFLLHLQLNGSSINRQDGREAVLNAGDFTLCDSTRPYDLTYSDINDMLVLRIPGWKLKERIHHPENLTCHTMSGHNGMSSVTSSFLTGLWESYETDWDDQYQDKVANIVLDTLSVSFADMCKTPAPESSQQHTRRLQIRQFIETNIYDPSLTPGYIAEAFSISSRYLHMLFKAEGETVAQYILRRRLEEAAKQLADANKKSATISEIAYSLGFNNITHFGRVFKDKYGATPRDSRHR